MPNSHNQQKKKKQKNSNLNNKMQKKPSFINEKRTKPRNQKLKLRLDQMLQRDPTCLTSGADLGWLSRLNSERNIRTPKPPITSQSTQPPEIHRLLAGLRKSNPLLLIPHRPKPLRTSQSRSNPIQIASTAPAD